jgi:hypothetical protein
MTLRPRVGPPRGLWAIDTELPTPRLGFVRVVRGSEASVRPSGKTPPLAPLLPTRPTPIMTQGVRRWRQGWTQRCAESRCHEAGCTRQPKGFGVHPQHRDNSHPCTSSEDEAGARVPCGFPARPSLMEPLHVSDVYQCYSTHLASLSSRGPIIPAVTYSAYVSFSSCYTAFTLRSILAESASSLSAKLLFHHCGT